MTTPTILSDVAANPFEAKRHVDGGVFVQKAIASIPAAAAADTNIGMIRIQKGASLVGLSITSDDLDTGTVVLLDVGFLLDNTTGEDDNAFFDNLDIAQDAGSRVWPIDDGLLTGISFVAPEDGYISVTTRAAVTTTLGDITVIAALSYDL
jgi:hypothetical protein